MERENLKEMTRVVTMNLGCASRRESSQASDGSWPTLPWTPLCLRASVVKRINHRDTETQSQ